MSRARQQLFPPVISPKSELFTRCLEIMSTGDIISIAPTDNGVRIKYNAETFKTEAAFMEKHSQFFVTYQKAKNLTLEVSAGVMEEMELKSTPVQSLSKK